MFDCVSIVRDQTPQPTIHTNRLENHIYGRAFGFRTKLSHMSALDSIDGDM